MDLLSEGVWMQRRYQGPRKRKAAPFVAFRGREEEGSHFPLLRFPTWCVIFQHLPKVPAPRANRLGAARETG
jgi:hypothetical protein